MTKTNMKLLPGMLLFAIIWLASYQHGKDFMFGLLGLISHITVRNFNIVARRVLLPEIAKIDCAVNLNIVYFCTMYQTPAS